jgi:hypothetical protein
MLKSGIAAAKASCFAGNPIPFTAIVLLQSAARLLTKKPETCFYYYDARL